MEADWLLRLERARDMETIEELRACNLLSAAYGLALTEAGMRELAAQRSQALERAGRVEFGGGILSSLIAVFCDSPYLTRENYLETLMELQESFYYFKTEAMERFSDDELLALMKGYFDGVCQGSLEYLTGTTLEELCRAARNGGFGGEAW
ncbi:hypothetical protein SDC9_108026 [bioreactor metagenome]|uniref:Uncharacterized protein n=1 Tax=bioreactor metagenome TaxID=1076179 RepID=A0A645B6V5_9ZZZZ